MTDELIWYHGQLINTDAIPTLINGDGDSEFNDLVLSELENVLVLSVTLDEYTKLLSSALNGVYTTYPNDYLNVLYPLIKAAKVSLCDAIIQCIDTTPELQQQIAQYSLSSAIDSNSEPIQANEDSQLINNQAGCDNDNIYGMTIQFVELLNAVSEDILEIFVSAPTVIARLGDIIEAIPGVGELPLDDAFQFVEGVMDDWNQAYQAAFTESLKVEIACDLFCIAQNNGCVLTLRDANQYFLDKLAGMQPSGNYLQFMEQLLVYNWIGVATVYGMFLTLTYTLIVGGEILGLDVDRIVTLVNAMFNDPDSDWSINCTECQQVWVAEWLSGNGNPHLDGWDSILGTWDANDEWLYGQVNGSGQSRLVYLEYIFTEATTLTKIRQVSTINSIGGTSRPQNIEYHPDGQPIQVLATVDKTSPDNETYELEWTGELAVNVGDSIFVWNSVNETGTNPQTIMKELEVNGYGTNPYE